MDVHSHMAELLMLLSAAMWQNFPMVPIYLVAGVKFICDLHLKWYDLHFITISGLIT